MPKMISTNNFFKYMGRNIGRKDITSKSQVKNNRKQKQSQGPQILELSVIDYKTMLGIFKEIKDRHKSGGDRNYKFW